MIGTVTKPATRGRVAGVEVRQGVASGVPGTGVPAGIASGYSPVKQPKHREVPCPGGRDHAVDGEVRQGVGTEVGAHLLDVHGGGDQFSARREVDAEEARPQDGRGRDAHVHLGCPGLTQHLDQRALRITTHDGVVDDDQALALMTRATG